MMPKPDASLLFVNALVQISCFCNGLQLPVTLEENSTELLTQNGKIYSFLANFWLLYYITEWSLLIQALIIMITRSIQTAQTSVECQHNSAGGLHWGHLFCVCWQRGSSSWIWIVVQSGHPDPDSDADRHQNVIIWSLGHTTALHKISSKSIGNFFDRPNPVNQDFGLLDPDVDPDRHLCLWNHPTCWRCTNKIIIIIYYYLSPWSLGHAMPLQEILSKSVHNFVSYPTDRQTDRQTRVTT